MVDILNNYDQVYKKWENRAKPHLNSQDDGPRSRRSNNLPPSRTYMPKQMFSQIQSNKLVANFKTSPLAYPTVDGKSSRKIFLGYACSKCTPTSRASLLDEICQNLGMRNMFHVPQQNKNRSIIIRQFAHLNYALHCRNFKYTEPTIDILSNKRIKEGIKKSAEQDSNNVTYHENRAKMCFKSLRSSLSVVLLRFTAWFLLKVLGRIFTSIQVHDGQIKALKRTENVPKPVVYLPLHRSHLDYILITLVLFLNDVRVPLIAAGDNLRIPIFGGILRRLGGFFIKRKLDNSAGQKDFAYRSILHAYVVESLKLGNSLEFFLEGGRSRTGKSYLPKAGLLSIIIDAYCDGDIEDAYIVPVSVSFEKLVEGNFISEQMGHKKKKETFFGAISNIWSSLNNNYGNVRIDFDQPFILSEYVESLRSCQPPSPVCEHSICPTTNKSIIKSASILSLYGADIAMEERRQLINLVAQHIVFDATNYASLMCTNLIAFLLLTLHREGVDKNVLINDFELLCEDLTVKKKNVGFTGETEDVVDYALQILGRKLLDVQKFENSTQQVFIKPNVELPLVLELSYYSAPVVTAYFNQSVVATAIIMCANVDIVSLKGCKSEIVLDQDDLLEVSLGLCDMMQFEHIFCPPCENLQMTITNIIEDFATQEILLSSENIGENYDKIRAKSLMECIDGDNYDDYWKSPQFTLNLKDNSVEKLCFLRSVLNPYLESYWITSVQLYKLLQNEMEEKLFIKFAQNDILKRLEDRLLMYNESASLESIKNALKLLEIWGVVEHCRQDNIKLLYLGENYKNSDHISSIISKFQVFRS